MVLERLRKTRSTAAALPRHLIEVRLPAALLYVGMSLWSASIPLLATAPYSQLGLLFSPGGALLVVAASFVLFAIVAALRAGDWA